MTTPRTKRFGLPASAIRPLVEGKGSCIASDQITVDGKPVGYMYREAPDGPFDSGWRFFSGEESQEYADDPDHFGLYDVNTVANYDPAIIAYLDADPESAFSRTDTGAFTPDEGPPDPND